MSKRKCNLRGGAVECKPPEDRVYTPEDVRSSGRSGRSGDPFSVARGGSAPEMVEDALGKLGGMCEFVGKGDLVAVKANITGGTPGMSHTFTDHEVLSSVVEQIRGCGADPVVYDSSMVWTDMDYPAEKAGFYEWGELEGVPVVNLTELPRVRFDFGEGSVIGEADASQLLVEADAIVNVPVAKTHIMTAITAGMKNMYGSMPTKDKAKFHSYGINEVIRDVNKAFTPTLTVMDMMRGCEGGGPLSCTTLEPEPKTVIASPDVVCADEAVVGIMGYDEVQREGIRHLRAAREGSVGGGGCWDEVTDKLDREHPRDFEWFIIEDEGSFAQFFTDAIENATRDSELMISFMDRVSEPALGWSAYILKGKMANFWDIALYELDGLHKRLQPIEEGA